MEYLISFLTLFVIFILIKLSQNKNKKIKSLQEYLSSKKTLIIITLSVVLFVLFNVFILFAKQPEIIFLEPQDNKSIQAETIIIKGEVKPQNSIININNKTITKNKGSFSYTAELPEENNQFNIVISNKNKIIQKSLTITRIFTPEEIAEKERKKEEEEAKIKAEEERKANELAEWEKTKAGKICSEHFLNRWTKEDCERVADGKIWIGMSYDMLVKVYGRKPNSANPSNYGFGTEWQWCWHNYIPSCFYDNNDDGIIDSYN